MRRPRQGVLFEPKNLVKLGNFEDLKNLGMDIGNAELRPSGCHFLAELDQQAYKGRGHETDLAEVEDYFWGWGLGQCIHDSGLKLLDICFPQYGGIVKRQGGPPFRLLDTDMPE